MNRISNENAANHREDHDNDDDLIIVNHLDNCDLDRPSEQIEQNIICCGRNLNLTKSQFIVLSLIIPYIFLTSSYYSLFAPFLPGFFLYLMIQF